MSRFSFLRPPFRPSEQQTTRFAALRDVLHERSADTNESTRFLIRWLVVGSIIGVCAGLGAVAFSKAIGLVTRFALADVVGYMPPMPVGEGSPVIHAITRAWLLPVVMTVGGLISGAIVFRWAPEAEGHGTDAAIEAIHFRNGRVSPKVAIVKLVSSAITIGTGGSAGREGPAAQISTGIASMVSDRIGLSLTDRRIAVCAGMGAGIGAIFRAPLGGALMAAEILYLHDTEVEVLIPTLITSIVAAAVYGSIEGWEPIFGAQPEIAFQDPLTLVWYAVLGVVLGMGGILYARSFYGTQSLFRRVPTAKWIKPAIGGFLVGCLGLVIKGGIHTGYGWIQDAMTADLLTWPLWMVIALPFAKILTTSLTVGSGGSGGIFGPGMVIGGMFGATFWRLGHDILPHMPSTPAPFVIIGMMGLFGSIAHAPFAMMLMVAEMTGNLSMLAPAMICVAVASAFVGDHTIYRSQLRDRESSPLHRTHMSFPLLGALTARDAARPAQPDDVPSDVSVNANVPLDQALLQLTDHDVAHARVTDGRRDVGVLSYRSAIETYEEMADAGVRGGRSLPSSALVVEADVSLDSHLRGSTLRNAEFPEGTLVVEIQRDGRLIPPTADTVLHAGDRLSVVVRPEYSRRVLRLIRGG